jgi:hypothetical protein
VAIEQSGGLEFNPSGIITPKGHVDIKVFNRNNEVVRTISNHNLIMTAGLNKIAMALTTNTTLEITHIAYGSGSVVPTQSDTRLIEEEGRERVFAKTARGAKAIFGTYFGFDHTADNPVCEFGLITDAPNDEAGSGILFARTTIGDSIIKSTDSAFSITWTIEFLVGDVT